MFAVSARVVAEEVGLIEDRPCFCVDCARDAEDGWVEDFALANEDVVY